MCTFNFLPEGWKDEISEVTIDKFTEDMVQGKILQGFVQSCDNQYNLHVSLGNGVTGIIPRSEVEGINLLNGLPKKNLCTGKVHRYVQFKVKELSDENAPILSRKDVQQEALKSAIQNLQIGQVINGIVKNITSYGAFVEIGGGVVGLIHIEDLSVARIKTPFERLKLEQKIQVVVKGIDYQKSKITLSYKENFGNWEENANKFKEGQKVRGIIRETEKNKNGIFIELTPNLVGMSEYQEGLKYGEDVQVYIKKIDYNKKKVKLSIV